MQVAGAKPLWTEVCTIKGYNLIVPTVRGFVFNINVIRVKSKILLSKMKTNGWNLQ
jgi:hypothetical protein